MTRVLVLNAGSSSLKASLLDADAVDPIAATQVEWGSDASRATDLRRGLQRALDDLDVHAAARQPDVAGHRVVHGGTRFRAADADRRHRAHGSSTR